MRYLKFGIPLIALLILGNVFSQENTASNEQKSKFFKDQFTNIKNPFELRDPF